MWLEQVGYLAGNFFEGQRFFLGGMGSAFFVGRLYSVQYKSIFRAPDKVRRDTCDKARPLSQVWGVEPNTLSGYELARPTHHLRLIAGMQDCIPT